MRSKFPSNDDGVIQASWLLPISSFGYDFHGHSLDTFTHNGTLQVKIGDLICTNDYFLFKISGPIVKLNLKENGLASWEHRVDQIIERIYWQDWSSEKPSHIFHEVRKTKIRFEYKLVVASSDEVPCETFIQVFNIETKPQTLLTEITYCPTSQNFIFRQNTEFGLRNITIHVQLNETGTFEVKEGMRVSQNGNCEHSFGHCETSFKTREEGKWNSLVSKRTKFIINAKREGYAMPYVQYSNLLITNSK